MAEDQTLSIERLTVNPPCEICSVGCDNYKSLPLYRTESEPERLSYLAGSDLERRVPETFRVNGLKNVSPAQNRPMKKHIYPIVINNKLTNISASSLYKALIKAKEINRDYQALDSIYKRRKAGKK